MTGREHEDEMFTLAAEYDAAVVLCFVELGQRPRRRRGARSTPTRCPTCSTTSGPGSSAPAPSASTGSCSIPAWASTTPTSPTRRPGCATRPGCWPSPSGSGRSAYRCATRCPTPSTCSRTSSARPRASSPWWRVLGGTQLFRTHEVAHVRAVLDGDGRPRRGLKRTRQPRWPRTDTWPDSRLRAIVRRWISSVPS